MKKNIARFSFIFIFCFITQPGLHAQIDSLIGNWRWVSGRDTLFLLIKPVKEKGTSTRPILSELYGYHRYIKNGEVIESNMHLVTDTISGLASIAGGSRGAAMHYLFHDLTSDRYFNAIFHLMKEFPGHAWLEMKYIGESNFPMDAWERPPGRTIPDNIVLERIGAMPPFRRAR